MKKLRNEIAWCKSYYAWDFIIEKEKELRAEGHETRIIKLYEDGKKYGKLMISQ